MIVKKKLIRLIAKLLILSLLVCLISLGISECCLRIIKNSKEFIKKLSSHSYEAYEGKEGSYNKYENTPLMKYNSFIGFSPLENKKTLRYQTNQYGFRYKYNFPIKKPHKEIRIFITGGSTAWGSEVSQEDLYATKLERHLQSKFPDYKIRCISAGISAHVSTNERINIQNKLIAFKPDVVVMFSGWNDTLAGYKGTSVLDNWDFFEVAPILAKHRKPYAISREATEDLRPPVPDHYILKTHYYLSKLIYVLKHSKNTKTLIQKSMIDPELVVQELVTNIVGVYDISKRNNFKLVFYLQPTLYNTKKILTPYECHLIDETMYNTGFPEYNSNIYNRYRRNIPKIASQEGFYFFDGDEAVSSESRTAFVDVVHFGDRGNRLISEHMASIIGKILNDLKNKAE